MTDLTDKWKKGELPDGYYYCKLIINNMKPSVERCKAHRIPMGVSADKDEEVLAPVPSYEEYDNIIKCYEHAHKQNEILRELLKSARVYVETDTQDYEDRTPTKGDIEAAKKLLAKIDEALK